MGQKVNRIIKTVLVEKGTEIGVEKLMEKTGKIVIIVSQSFGQLRQRQISREFRSDNFQKTVGQIMPPVDGVQLWGAG